MLESSPHIASKPQKDRQFWNEHIKLKQESGLSRAAYCRKYGIVCGQFGYWENKLKSAQPELSQLLPIKLNLDNAASHHIETKCTIALKSGHKLKVHDHSILPLLISLLS